MNQISGLCFPRKKAAVCGDMLIILFGGWVTGLTKGFLSDSPADNPAFPRKG